MQLLTNKPTTYAHSAVIFVCGILLAACSTDTPADAEQRNNSEQVVAGQAPQSEEQNIEALTATCASCHGADGLSPNDDWPNLAGQNVDYLVLQMTAFRDGERENALMSAALLAGVTDAQLQEIAQHYAALPVPKGAEFAELSNLPGAHVRALCVSCHGMTGNTVTSKWPNLAGQKPNYLAQQLRDYKSGARNHPIMATIANELTEQQMVSVAEYFGRQ